MEAWTWLLAYVLGFVLLQLVLYRYFQRDSSTREQPTRHRRDHTGARTDTGTESSLDTVPDRAGDRRSEVGPESTDTIQCRHCGAPNESVQTFTYCRRCTEPLR